MKKKALIIFLAIVSSIVLSILSEVFIFNFKNLTLGKESKGIFELSFDTKTVNDEVTIRTDLNSQFIDKLIINYQTDQNVDYRLSYTKQGLYDQEETTEIPTDIFSDTFNHVIININQNISSLTIQYQETENLTIEKILIDNNFHFNYFRTIFIALCFITIFFLYLFYKDGFKTEKLHIYFATICTLLGSMLIIAQPATTFYSWDDQIHFANVVEWFGGTIHYSNGEYNSSDYGIENSNTRYAINSFEEKQQQINYLNSEAEHNITKIKRPIPDTYRLPYLPMAIGYNLAKIIKLPFAACFMIGKLFGLIFYAYLIAYAIKITKAGKCLLAFASLIPINIFIASNYSYDPAVFIGITIFLVHIINLFVDKSSKLNFKTTAIMILAITYACFAKAIYAPFLFLTLFIPKEKIENPKKSYLIKIGFSILMLTLIALPLFSDGVISDPRGGNTSVSEQVSLVLNHPFDYASILNNTAVKQFSLKFIGAHSITNFAFLGSLGENSNLYLILIVFLIFIFITDNQNNSLNKKQRLLILGVILSIIILIWTSLYLSFNEVGSTTIIGVQGRYFLPLLFPLLLSLQPKNIQNKINPKYYNLFALSIPTIITIISIYTLILYPFSF